ncbi:MAG: DUF1538 family protein [Clostridia bacterium]|nr:DUF1538 family protein [Clostridia bacterium]
MQIFKNIKSTFLSLLPILAIVLTIDIFFYHIETEILLKFLVSILLVCIGESLLLTGIDSTIMPMGELMVNSVNKAAKMFIFVFFAVIFGLCATIAEPDITIFSGQVIDAGIGISKTLFVFFIGFGVGIFIAFAIVRMIENISLKYVYIFLFAIIFLLGTQVKPEYMTIAFDAGGATTGIITAPFLLAVSTGIATKFSKNKSNNEAFGMVGMASLGPVIAVLLFFVIFGEKIASGVISTSNLNIFLVVFSNAALAILPIAIVFLIYDLLLIKLPIKRKLGFVIGLFITFGGLYLFLFGIDFGVSSMGTQIGNFMASLSTPVLILLCVVFGFIITFTEPSVIVLAKQVQSTTKGNIPYVLVIITIAIAMAIAIALAALKIIYQINFFYIILVGYTIALVLMFFVPDMFTGLAFDSGGVASGPMTSAFVLPIMIALAASSSNPMDGFGVIGIVGMSPIIVLQLLGLFYRFELIHIKRADQKIALRVSYSADLYSNIEKLEHEYNKMKERKSYEKK